MTELVCKVHKMHLDAFKAKYPDGTIIPKTANAGAKGYILYLKESVVGKPGCIWVSEKEFNAARKEAKMEMRKDKSTIAKCRKTFEKMMKKANAKQWDGLIQFMQAADNSAYAYRYHAAELNRSWGHPSYLGIYNLSSGRHYEMVPKNSKAYREVAKAVKEVKAIMHERDEHIGLSGVAKADGGDHYIAFITGGNNGSPDWVAYLETLSRIVKSQKHAWLIEMHRHSDIYYVLMGFTI